ncbi:MULTISPECIES: SDR family NAD(P)-dependent oxidoreductase [unclassified Pseudomonas]|uniref:SDR family NAD(P)-dependent oxidoreductase n=1 Tax=unclassified Pseudomonas TaxID=196821 RepID=UPI0008774BCD|nr:MULTISPECIES: SDR family oxidoreductase [unclassified Pseudomonas]SCZ20699.1 NAD(P)-dependent dehydrogenase, short-chain alcohol dehydrogenase family [Pseudomonas sp. NFACC44-2]SDA43933.1 NAD(P)-dependent dehydrogenase, short-chain alcohol dehydrogenase family [Pseudomonas sp. NFACC51]SFH09820.1 NAD(P)-dependent dehydrogenase, short-chain alcohol dehydrogenase family [Pseudomonas sp. NFACC54]SFS43640.1 NAD(P)-dependent dehydrogenase, short-chain alcohol dehydrogenase family [Pseudomonas sp. 
MRALTGQRAFVTGGSKGIGEAIVRRLAAEGAKVVIAAQDMISAERLADEVGGLAVRLDVTDLLEVERVVTMLGPFEILVNNAGYDQHDFFTKTTVEQWRYLLAVNLEGVFASTHAALPAMQAAGYGRIINVGSEAGRQGSKGGAVYAAAKGGVIAFSKSIARENARYGITVNVVAPGPVDTPLLRKALDCGGEKLLAAMEASTLVGRLGEPNEVAAAVVFLASRDASFITGETLGVSGGMGC